MIGQPKEQSLLVVIMLIIITYSSHQVREPYVEVLIF